MTFQDPNSKRLFRRCGNEICTFVGVANDPQWAKRKKASGFFYLCSTCADCYKKNQYCDFCKQVYYDGNSDVTDGKEWLQCDSCYKWNHLDCEHIMNNNPEIYDLAKDDEFKYYCVTCCKSKKPSVTKASQIQKKTTAPLSDSDKEEEKVPVTEDDQILNVVPSIQPLLDNEES